MGFRDSPLRHNAISASEAAAILTWEDGTSQHRFMDAMTVYRRLVDPQAERQVTQAMRVGQLLEPAIIQAAREFYLLDLRTNYRTLPHPRYPVIPLCATPDAYVLDGRGLVEAKAVSPFSSEKLARYVEIQVQVQMACTGREYVHVIMLRGTAVSATTFDRDAETIEMVEDAAVKFWAEHVATRTPPTVSKYLFRSTK